MKLHSLNRKVHYWASVFVAVPLLVIVCTGILLQVKKNFDWVQPPEIAGAVTEPALCLSRVIEICAAIPEAQISGWDDVARVEVRPGKALLKVVSTNRCEIQLCASTGNLLQIAHRRSDLIESLHDGSWFHPAAKLWVFLPAGVVLLGLLLTGVFLFFVPILAKRRGRLVRAAASRG